MKKTRIIALFVMCIFVTGIFIGCSGSYGARSVKKNTVFVNPKMLEKGTGDQALYRYVNPDISLAEYSRVIIEPVIIYRKAQMSDSELKNYKVLANNAYYYLKKELKKDYRIVRRSRSNTLRVQFAIIEADTSKPVRNLVSSVVPISIGVSLAKYAATGKQTGVGEITGEIILTDAETGELLGAALDRRVGGKSVEGIYDTWSNADDALKFWAKKMRYVLCTERGGSDCVKP